MKKVLAVLILNLTVVLCPTGYAQPNIDFKLNKINFQIDRAEIFAANCTFELQDPTSTHENCAQAADILKKLTEKLDNLEKNNVDPSNGVADNIRQMRSKITQVTRQISEADQASNSGQALLPLRDAQSVSN